MSVIGALYQLTDGMEVALVAGRMYDESWKRMVGHPTQGNLSVAPAGRRRYQVLAFTVRCANVRIASGAVVRNAD